MMPWHAVMLKVVINYYMILCFLEVIAQNWKVFGSSVCRFLIFSMRPHARHKSKQTDSPGTGVQASALNRGCVHDSGCVFLSTQTNVVFKFKHFLHRFRLPYLARVDFGVHSSTRLPCVRNSQVDCKSRVAGDQTWARLAERKRLFNFSKRCSWNRCESNRTHLRPQS